MNHAGMAFIVGAFFCMSAAAQSQTDAQAGAQGGGQASAQAGQTKAQASGNASSSGAAAAPNRQANSSLAMPRAINAALRSPIDSKKNNAEYSRNAHPTENVNPQRR